MKPLIPFRAVKADGLKWAWSENAHPVLPPCSILVLCIALLQRPLRCETAMTNDVEQNKALIRAHYEATVNHFDPAAIDEQVADDFFDHAAGTRLGPEGVIRFRADEAGMIGLGHQWKFVPGLS